MIELVINGNNEGQRLDKYLFHHLPEASHGFIYKMLRKKNIVLNKGKASGNEILCVNDLIHIYFSDETYEKFRGRQVELKKTKSNINIDIIYEDSNIILANKPVNMLSQKSNNNDISINDLIIDYLISKNDSCMNDIRNYKPSICNRLDRNTSGIIIFAKTYSAARQINDALHNRTIEKYYVCVVAGVTKEQDYIKAYHIKDTANNLVNISDEFSPNSDYIETKYKKLSEGNNCSMLEVELLTGKSHQIRAHLSFIGHPIIGDTKYFNDISKEISKKNNVRMQLLHSYRLKFPAFKGELSYLSEKEFKITVPDKFYTVLNN